MTRAQELVQETRERAAASQGWCHACGKKLGETRGIRLQGAGDLLCLRCRSTAKLVSLRLVGKR